MHNSKKHEMKMTANILQFKLNRYEANTHTPNIKIVHIFYSRFFNVEHLMKRTYMMTGRLENVE